MKKKRQNWGKNARLYVVFFTHLNTVLRCDQCYLKLLTFVTETSGFILYHL